MKLASPPVCQNLNLINPLPSYQLIRYLLQAPGYNYGVIECNAESFDNGL